MAQHGFRSDITVEWFIGNCFWVKFEDVKIVAKLDKTTRAITFTDANLKDIPIPAKLLKPTEPQKARGSADVMTLDEWWNSAEELSPRPGASHGSAEVTPTMCFCDSFFGDEVVTAPCGHHMCVGCITNHGETRFQNCINCGEALDFETLLDLIPTSDASSVGAESNDVVTRQSESEPEAEAADSEPFISLSYTFTFILGNSLNINFKVNLFKPPKQMQGGSTLRALQQHRWCQL